MVFVQALVRRDAGMQAGADASADDVFLVLAVVMVVLLLLDLWWSLCGCRSRGLGCLGERIAAVITVHVAVVGRL